MKGGGGSAGWSLEARYLCNKDPNLHFALLTDHAGYGIKPSVAGRGTAGGQGARAIEALNVKYADGKGGSFLLLHRHRVFNVRQGVWMGWERKRGKLMDLNRLLLQEMNSFPRKDRTAGGAETHSVM